MPGFGERVEVGGRPHELRLHDCQDLTVAGRSGQDDVAGGGSARHQKARAALSTPDLSGRVTEVRLWQKRAPEDEPAEDKGSR